MSVSRLSKIKAKSSSLDLDGLRHDSIRNALILKASRLPPIDCGALPLPSNHGPTTPKNRRASVGSIGPQPARGIRGTLLWLLCTVLATVLALAVVCECATLWLYASDQPGQCTASMTMVEEAGGASASAPPEAALNPSAMSMSPSAMRRRRYGRPLFDETAAQQELKRSRGRGGQGRGGEGRRALLLDENNRTRLRERRREEEEEDASGNEVILGGSEVDSLKQTDVVFFGGHNSYHRAPRWWRFPFWSAAVSQWQYSHAPLRVQLEKGSRHFELDVHVSLSGNVLVYHLAAIDWGTRCFCFATCIRELRRWSLRRGQKHSLIFIQLELKGGRLRKFGYLEDARSLVNRVVSQSGPRDAERRALEAVDKAVFAAFSDDRSALLTPDDLRRPNETLSESIAKRGWPSVGALSGKFAFSLLDSSAELLTEIYTRPPHSSLERRALFTMSNNLASTVKPPDHVALFRLDDASDPEQFDAIKSVVKRGFMVRTRANTQKKPINDERFDAARRSGAQLVTFEAEIQWNWRRFLARAFTAKSRLPEACAVTNFRSDTATKKVIPCKFV